MDMNWNQSMDNTGPLNLLAEKHRDNQEIANSAPVLPAFHRHGTVNQDPLHLESGGRAPGHRWTPKRSAKVLPKPLPDLVDLQLVEIEHQDSWWK